MANNSSDVEKAATIIALFVFGPAIVLFAIAAVLNVVGPYLPATFIVLLLAGIGYGVYRFQSSAPTIRRQHEKDVLELVQRAEAQQATLPRAIVVNDLRSALDKLRIAHGAIQLSVIGKAA